MWYNSSMERFDLSEARKRLPELATRAASGESFEFTRYGKLVAVLGPPVEEGVLMEEVAEVGDLKVHQPIKADTQPSTTIDALEQAGPTSKRVAGEVRRIGLSKKDQAGGKYDR